MIARRLEGALEHDRHRRPVFRAYGRHSLGERRGSRIGPPADLLLSAALFVLPSSPSTAPPSSPSSYGPEGSPSGESPGGATRR